ncbi:PREDICTED: LOW QUALITY PROTEIN: class I histocompatibility antigen, F10 alpha chain-like, partial [Sturnus vulgaris]|uniref:LOW QUALITY PROTEIN: class I histocompatibility antigen, F10 alpha chain-like n=1 Tax=Sturnus vulgaris TaxID=9172 RepID=UPI00071A8309
DPKRLTRRFLKGVPDGSQRAPGDRSGDPEGSRGILWNSPTPLPPRAPSVSFVSASQPERPGSTRRPVTSLRCRAAIGGQEISAPMAKPEAALRAGSVLGAGPVLGTGPQRSSAMPPELGLLLGLLELLWDPGGAPKVLHSLRYLSVAVSEPSPGVPEFMMIGFLDGIPFVRYDSERGRAVPLTKWIKDGAEPEYWDRMTETCKWNEHMDAWNLETLRDRYNQSRGLHTLFTVHGCDLLSDGSIRGSYRDGYDGRDFLSFDLGSRRFVAADSAAEITRRRWEHENEAKGFTNYLGHECPEWLQKYIGYGQKELDRKGGSRIPVGMWDLGMEDLGP